MVQKWPFFHFLLGNIGQEKVFYDILEGQKRHSRLQKQEVSKVEKLTFFPKGLTHVFGPKMPIFPTFFFLGIFGQENVFYDIPERKNAFLGFKKKKFKKSKMAIFPKGLTHALC